MEPENESPQTDVLIVEDETPTDIEGVVKWMGKKMSELQAQLSDSLTAQQETLISLGDQLQVLQNRTAETEITVDEIAETVQEVQEELPIQETPSTESESAPQAQETPPQVTPDGESGQTEPPVESPAANPAEEVVNAVAPAPSRQRTVRLV